MRVIRRVVVSLVLLGWIVPFAIAAYYLFQSVIFSPVDDFDNWNAVGFDFAITVFLVVGVLWLLFSIIAYLLGLRATRPELPGMCRRCEYDLRGLSEPRCPECGTPFDPSKIKEQTLSPAGNVACGMVQAKRSHEKTQEG